MLLYLYHLNSNMHFCNTRKVICESYARFCCRNVVSNIKKWLTSRSFYIKRQVSTRVYWAANTKPRTSFPLYLNKQIRLVVSSIKSMSSCNVICVCVGFSFHSRMFYSYWNVTIGVEGIHILNYARCSWPLSSESSLACQTYCDTGQPFINVIIENPWHSHILRNV